MSDREYNGWVNYATWKVNLEFCDDACNSWAEDRVTFSDEAELANALEETVNEYLDLIECDPESWLRDLANSFLADVNWLEIAENHAEELVEAVCSECGESLEDGAGYDGLCGNCSDARQEDEEDERED